MSHSPLTNTLKRYGWISIFLHWILGLALIAMYFLGDWMVGLSYYHTWYHRAPEAHKAVGVIIGFLMVFRVLWNVFQTKPRPIEKTKIRTNRIANVIHYILYLLVFAMVLSGYLISTAKGQGIDVFGLFELPAFFPKLSDGGELAGDLHELIGTGFIILVALHALAALIHHFVFKDRTLRRMLRLNKQES